MVGDQNPSARSDKEIWFISHSFSVQLSDSFIDYEHNLISLRYKGKPN